MSDEITGRVNVLERKFDAMEARAEERHQREQRMEVKLDALFQDMNRRQGREAAAAIADDNALASRKERSKWLRAFVPTGLWVGVWSAIVWIAQKLTGGMGQ